MFFYSTNLSLFNPDSAKLTNPNACWRAGFSLVPGIPAGCAGKCKVNALVQGGKIDIAKEPATILSPTRVSAWSKDNRVCQARCKIRTNVYLGASEAI